MRILLFGKNGQVGWELNRSLQPLGEVIALGRNEADFSNPETLRPILQKIQPDVVVNAVAYTAVDKAEEEEKLATTINADAVAVLAEETKKLNALLIHYSTDYVFDGSKTTPYNEDDIPNPINTYGRSKLAGEEAIKVTGCKYFIFRTSWVYASRGNNFAVTMLRLAAERDQLNVVSDQFGAPTGSDLIADVTAQVLHQTLTSLSSSEALGGTYHLTASGKTTWYGFTQQILKVAIKNGQSLRVMPEQVGAIMTAGYPTPAKRPINSALCVKKLCSTFDVTMPPWLKGVEYAVTEIVS